MDKEKRTLFSVFFLFVLLLSAAVSADDSVVMSALLKALSPTPSGWSDSKPYCSWTNVKCDSSNSVTFINLDTQSLSGTLPADLGSLIQLRTLSLQRNKLTGALPSLANLNSLQSLSLSSNNFTSIPAGFFKGLTSLQSVSLSDNLNLEQWSIPTDLSESTNLVNFYADNAQINGTLPDFLGSLPGLQNLRISYNYLTGPLPSTFGGSSIQNLWLNNQLGTGLSGTLDVLSSMEQLSQVWLQKNAFTGPIPDLSNCENLFDLQLRDNELTGIVPTSLLSSSSLQNLTLDNNKLQGPAPDNPNKIKLTYDGNNFCNGNTPGPCDTQVTTLLEVVGALGYPTTLADSWTGNDACKSWVFISCQESKVITVNFERRNFKGMISPAFANLTSLQKLYLNNNNLTGSIPSSLITLTQLQILDVSNNNLSGLVPLFPATVKLTTTGNPLLGKNGTTGDTPSSPSGSGTNSPNSSSSKSSLSPLKITLIVIAVIVLLGVTAFCFYKFCYLKRPRRFNKVTNPENGSELVVKNWVVTGSNGYGGVPSELQSQSSGDHNNELPVFEGGNVAISIQVLRQVTDNFNEKNILGRGGFGVVYKGELNDGTMIAVKRMESVAMGNKGMNEFQAEIAVLTKVRHRHLVALLGYCTTDNERLLVYEYMPQGTLTQHLFEWQERGVTVPLTWKQRVTIALDVARGVEYLHSLAQQSFIHRDLKPSNILLSDDMRAKVADFGLVKNAPDGKYSVETRLAGTFGYLAPEYAATGRVTTKVDVYAFGVVLMELITGRKALDDSVPDERSHLVTWFRRVLINKENIPKVIDQSLHPDEETMESIYKVAELAGHCTAREPFQRPDMGHAVNILGPLVEQWKPSRHEVDGDGYGLDPNMSLPQALQRWQADEGTSRMFDDNSMSSQTQTSIASKPFGFPDSFHSSDCR